ncbi:hypothetical protein SDC9_143576 [bioreactor metagenome]|uniref:Uncharacterized protein n=1 Tax=bioreactor metagenome TaxID=1076179 RepID=A0A645E6H9_9ZZZZ
MKPARTNLPGIYKIIDKTKLIMVKDDMAFITFDCRTIPKRYIEVFSGRFGIA